jgi:hypothetical protein
MHRFLALLLAILAATACFAESAKPRVALLYSGFGDNRHRDDYDDRIPQLGWQMTKFQNTKIADLIAHLDDFDIVLGSALFNYGDPQDFGKYRDDWLKFVRRGGAIVLTDCNYPAHVDWLKAFGDEWFASVANCKSTSTAVSIVRRDHPLLTTPHVIPGIGAAWAQMTLGPAWQVLAKTAEGGVSWGLREEGRGFILLTTNWRYDPPLLQNLWTYTQFHRAGLKVALSDLAACHVGSNHLVTRLENLSAEGKPVSVVLRITKPDNTKAEVRGTATLRANGSAQVPADLVLDQRGQYVLSAAVLDAAGATAYESEDFTVRVPDLVEFAIASPTYRDSIYLANPSGAVRLRFTLTPYRQNLADLTLTVGLHQGTKKISERKIVSPSTTAFDVDLPFADLAAGEASIAVRATLSGKEVAAATKRMPVVAASPNQVFIDEAGTCRIGGKPFFPIGIYHVPQAALPQLKQMHFNACQAWGTDLGQARAFLDEAQKNDIHVLLEMGTFVTETPNLEGFRSTIRALHDHPALLTWYSRDEPSGPMLTPCRQAYEMITQEDANHPVYLVMCSPGEFDRFGTVTDILAIDPYPIASAPVNMVADWMKGAQAAVQGRRPIWLIPQLHNWDAYTDPKKGRAPTAAEERNMVYQGLIYGAKGIIYYPWDDGPTGITHEPQLMAEVPIINAELQTLGPKLLACERTVVKPAKDDAEIHAALFRGKTESFFIVASGKSQPCEPHFRLPGAKALELLYGTDTAQVNGGVLQENLSPLQVKVYAVKY